MNDILKMSLAQCAEMIRSKKISSLEVTKLSLERIEKEKALNNFITVSKEEALNAAKKADEKIANGEKLGALAGVPISVKDNISTKGIRTTCASKTLDNYVPIFDATVITALKNEDAVIVGKTNLDEFAMGSSCETSFYGPVRNFHDQTRIAGGSSGGSANCVASNEVFASLGSDTGGSIRQPAAYCGVIGLKPTYSSVSRNGAVALASSFDQIGPFTKTVSDSAALLNILSFYDEKDASSSKIKRPDYTSYKRDIKGLKIGLPKEFFSKGLDGAVKDSIYKSVKILEGQGAAVEEITFPGFDAALATYYVLSSAEAATNLARFDGIKYGFRKDGKDITSIYYNSRTEGFGDEVKRRIMMGNYVLSSGYYDAYYLKAMKVRTVIKNDFDKAFSKFDALVCPTVPAAAFKIGQKTDDYTKAYLSDIYTVPVNIAGLPAISAPCGRDGSGMPIGVQFIADSFNESILFSLAQQIEDAGVYKAKN